VHLLSISLHKKVLPAGMTLHANDSLPTVDRTSHFVHFLCLLRDFCSRACRELSKSCLCWLEIITVIATISITIPRNVRRAVGPSTFKGLTGAFSLLQTASMAEGLSAHSWVAGSPAVKKSSR